MRNLSEIVDGQDVVTKDWVNGAISSGGSYFIDVDKWMSETATSQDYVDIEDAIQTGKYLYIGQEDEQSGEIFHSPVTCSMITEDSEIICYYIEDDTVHMYTFHSDGTYYYEYHYLQRKLTAGNGIEINSNNVISGDVSDVQVGGTSIVNQQGVANINPAIFLDFFYRVGSYYETSDGDFDPNVVWGGTWVLETSGLVHVSGATGDANYPVSGTFTDANGGKGQKQDGNKDAIIPYHRHNVAAKATGGPSENTSGGQSQNHTHSPSNATNFMYYDSDVSGANVGRRNIGSGSGSYYTWTVAKTDALKGSTATGGTSQGHTHSLQNHTHTLGQHYTDYEGTNGNRTNANMQPYINVYRWHRIA